MLWSTTPALRVCPSFPRREVVKNQFYVGLIFLLSHAINIVRTTIWRYLPCEGVGKKSSMKVLAVVLGACAIVVLFIFGSYVTLLQGRAEGRQEILVGLQKFCPRADLTAEGGLQDCIDEAQKPVECTVCTDRDPLPIDLLCEMCDLHYSVYRTQECQPCTECVETQAPLVGLSIWGACEICRLSSVSGLGRCEQPNKPGGLVWMGGGGTSTW